MKIKIIKKNIIKLPKEGDTKKDKLSELFIGVNLVY